MTIQPSFDDLHNAETFVQHVNDLQHTEAVLPSSEIIKGLIDQIEPVDFEAAAFPHVVGLREQLTKVEAGSNREKEIRNLLDKIRIGNKHYLITTIESTIQLAEQNKWGLCKNKDFIYLYNGAFWGEIEADTFKSFLGTAAEKMGVPKFDARYHIFRDNLFKQFLTSAFLPTPDENLDAVLINLVNGTFEVTSKGYRLKPFDRNDFLTYRLPFSYDPNAKAPLFEAYLNRVLPDIERQRVLAEYLGYVFIKNGSGILKEEKALLLYGSGANGKSVFFEIVNALLGSENVSYYSMQCLTNENGYYRAKIANKLVNYASEIGGRLEAEMFKKLASGEPVDARLPYGNPMEIRQYGKLIFNCNELPKEVEHTNAYFRRFLIIPFDVTIPPEEQDKTLHSKIIKSELSGVFNWVLSGLSRLLKQGKFSKCEAAIRAVEKYKMESDSVKMFIDEHDYTVSDKSYTPHKEMWAAYQTYCSECRFMACGRTNFSNRLKSAGFSITKKSEGMVVNAVKNFTF